jgi:hypothetical protein
VEAWRLLVRRYLPLVYDVGTRAGLATAQRATLCLHVLERLARLLPALQDRPDLFPWVLRTTATISADLGLAPHAGASMLPNDEAEAVQQRHLFRRALMELDQPCQAILTTELTGQSVATRPESATSDPSEHETNRAGCLQRLLELLDRVGFRWDYQEQAGETGVDEGCAIPFDQLVSYAQGCLQGDALSNLMEHLSGGCDRCRIELARLEQAFGCLHAHQTTDIPSELTLAAEKLFAPGETPPASQWVAVPSRRRRARWILPTIVVVLLVVLGACAYVYRPVPRTGVVSELDPGELQVRLGQGAVWTEAREGQIVGQYARLRSAPGAAVLMHFWDGSLMRIESEGEWAIRRLSSSRQVLVTRTTISQRFGRASFASTPPGTAISNRFVVEIPNATIELAGTATITTTDTGESRIEVHQGSATVFAADERLVVGAHQELDLRSRSPSASAKAP